MASDTSLQDTGPPFTVPSLRIFLLTKVVQTALDRLHEDATVPEPSAELTAHFKSTPNLTWIGLVVGSMARVLTLPVCCSVMCEEQCVEWYSELGQVSSLNAHQPFVCGLTCESSKQNSPCHASAKYGHLRLETINL